MKTKSLVMICLMCIVSFVMQAQEVIKVGIIGLDTSHAPAFIGLLNSDDPKPEHQGFRVVAAYPYGSKTIENSYKRIPEYTERAKKNGVEIVSSITELLKKVDCVMLETNDGTLHLEQAIEVLDVERSTEYAMEQMFFVIDSRYRSRRPMIITTNLKLAELKNPPDLAHARIYDRILERCAPILFDGKNFREENAGATRQAAKDIVNSKHD